MAKCLPHCSHLYFSGLEVLRFVLPSLFNKESTVNDLIYVSGKDISEHVDEAGDTGGEQQSLYDDESPDDFILRSKGDSSSLQWTLPPNK